jgi:undecaprenyl phosphate-alpha-L-ara4N flippase subunit ArnE
LLAIGCLIATLTLTAASQVVQKRVGLRLQAGGDRPRRMLRQPGFWIALGLAGAALVFWLVVLSLWPVGSAYSLLSVNFVTVLLASRFLFQETVSPRAWSGTVLVAVGVLLIGWRGIPW